MAEHLFDLDALYAEERAAPFRFRWAGQDWELPSFGDIDWRAAGLQADLESAVDEDGHAEVGIDMLRQLFSYAFGPEQAARWEQVQQPTKAMTVLFEQWQKYAGANMGESPASTGSSPSTGRPSKRTSTTTTRSGSARRSTAGRKSGTARGSS